jgi:hypothetical protein
VGSRAAWQGDNKELYPAAATPMYSLRYHLRGSLITRRRGLPDSNLSPLGGYDGEFIAERLSVGVGTHWEAEMITKVNAGPRMDRLPICSFHKRVMWLVGMGMFFDSFDNTLSGSVLADRR